MADLRAVQQQALEVIDRFEPPLTVDPVVAAVAILLVVLAVGIAILWRRRRRTPGDRLLSNLEKFDDLAILMHPNPDPDAMGSALGVQAMAATRGTPATIYYAGQIRHQENRAFRTVLDVEFERLDATEEITESAIALVDHNHPRGFRGAEALGVDVVIDHHPGNGAGTEFTDVRDDYGACSTIIAEYYEEIGAEPTPGELTAQTDGGNPEHDGALLLDQTIATGLLFGIQADTDHLTKGCSPAEFRASSYLFPAANEDLFDRIANPQVTAEMLEIKARAIVDRKINGSFAVSDVGSIDDVDAIPQAADELIRLEGISAVVVYGDKNETIHVSGRSRDDRVHMGRTLEAVFEEVPMASAGGHARMGGGQVPLQYLAGIGPSAVDQDRARGDLRGRLFNALKGNV